MPSYLALRIISFLVVVGFSFLLPGIAWMAMIPLAIAHYILAIPYSRELIGNALRRPSTALKFFGLIGLSILLSIPQIPGLIFLTFSFHYAFSEVYLMCENILPRLWKETRPLRIASLLFNISVYFAATRVPMLGSQQLCDTINYSSCTIFMCTIVLLLFKLRHLLTRNQIIQVCAFESLGVLFALVGLVQPMPVTGFIFYHVVFWLFYPTSKMIQFKKTKSIIVFAAANILLAALVVLLAIFSPLKQEMTNTLINEVFRIGALFHIFASFGTTTAQPAWITRFFHPGFEHGVKELSPAKATTMMQESLLAETPADVPINAPAAAADASEKVAILR